MDDYKGVNKYDTDFLYLDKELKIKKKQEKELKRKQENNPINYYKSFNTKPSNFRKKYIDDSDDELILSSSESESESDDDNYPYPHTKKIYDYIQQLKDKINKFKIKYKKLELKVINNKIIS